MTRALFAVLALSTLLPTSASYACNAYSFEFKGILWSGDKNENPGEARGTFFPIFADLERTSRFLRAIDIQDERGDRHVVTVFLFKNTSNDWTLAGYINVDDAQSATRGMRLIGSTNISFGSDDRLVTEGEFVGLIPAFDQGAPIVFRIAVDQVVFGDSPSQIVISRMRHQTTDDACDLETAFRQDRESETVWALTRKLLVNALEM